MMKLVPRAYLCQIWEILNLNVWWANFLTGVGDTWEWSQKLKVTNFQIEVILLVHHLHKLVLNTDYLLGKALQ